MLGNIGVDHALIISLSMYTPLCLYLVDGEVVKYGLFDFCATYLHIQLGMNLEKEEQKLRENEA